MQFALDGQEEHDANFDEDNYIFFLSGNTTGKVIMVVYAHNVDMCTQHFVIFIINYNI